MSEFEPSFGSVPFDGYVIIWGKSSINEDSHSMCIHRHFGTFELGLLKFANLI